jgi:cell division protein FtsW (lipid II flippase)
MFTISKSERHARIDWLMLAGLGGLMLIGVLFVYSATMANESAALIAWYNQPWFRQVVWYIIGLGSMGAVCLVDYRILARWSLVIYCLVILLLIAVLIPGVGADRYGARRWIDLGPFSLQPSEFAKVAFILAMGNFLSRPQDELRSVKIFWQALGMVVLPFIIIMKEPDLGSALILLPVSLTMLFVSGVPPRYINTLVGASGLLVSLILVDVLFAPPQWQIKLEDYQKRRLLTYFGIDGIPKDATPQQRAEARRAQRNYSYNVDQALISVGLVQPNYVTGLGSTTHAVGVPKCSSSITMTWDPGTDGGGSGMAGYAYVWDHAPITLPGAINLGNVSSLVSNLAASSQPWYFHIRPYDNAGNGQNMFHAGPFYVSPNSGTTFCTAKINSLGCTPAMSFTGTPKAGQPSGYVIRGTNVRNNKSGLLFYGVNGGQAAPFQGGTLCVAAQIKRTTSVTSGGTPAPANDCTGIYSIDFSSFASGLLGGSPLPQLIVPGTTVSCQWWGRDPGFAAPNNTTLSNGLSFTICQ